MARFTNPTKRRRVKAMKRQTYVEELRLKRAEAAEVPEAEDKQRERD